MARAIYGLLLAAFIAFLIYAFSAGDFAATMAKFGEDPWLLVTLADLYFGFLLISVVIAAVVRPWWVAALWIVPIYFLGNVVTAVFILVYWKRLFGAFRPAAAQKS